MGRVKKGLNKRPPKVKLTATPSQTNKNLLRVPSTESTERFDELGLLVKQKKLKWSHFTKENDIGVHYYLILKRRK